MEGSVCMQGLHECENWRGLSEQQVLDCGSYDMNNSMNIGTCKTDVNRMVFPDKMICGTTNKNGPDAELMKNALYWKGPLAINMYVNNTFRDYKTGIYDAANTDCTEGVWDGTINHVMTAVGYGQENGIDYWIIKNSWGADSRGDQGYWKVKMGENICGIEQNVQYTNMVKTSGPSRPSGPEGSSNVVKFGLASLGLMFAKLF